MVNLNLKALLGLYFLIVLAVSPTFVDAREKPPIRVYIEGLSGRELQNAQIAAAPPEGLAKDGVVDERWMEHFRSQVPERVKKALEPFGYYNAEVSVSSGRADDGTHEIFVAVERGSPVHVTDITVEARGPGSTEPGLSALVRAFPLYKGARLDHDVYEKAKNAIHSKAVELGYLDADFAKREILVDPAEASARIQLILETGQLYYFGNIEFTGAPNYPQSFLGRFIEFDPGDVFSQQKIGESQKNFTNADRFRSVMIYADKEKAVNQFVPVEVELKESKPKRLRMGVGYETDIGPKGVFKYEDVNFRKTGNRFQAEFDLSVPLAAAAVRYMIPHPEDIKSYSLLSFTAKREDYRDAPKYFGSTIPDYFAETLMAEYERARSFGKAGTGSVFLQLLKEKSEAGEDTTDSFSVLPGFRLQAIEYDNLVRPQRGHRYLLEIKGTHQAIGSTTGFVQFIGDGGVVVPLPARFALLTRLRVGATVQNEEDLDMPIALRFFAGGDKSVRGYKYRSLGPTDDEGNVIGGKNMLAGSIELERAIGKDWGIAVFYDVGNAFNDFGRLELAEGAGIGGRYYSPIGPIRLDVARQINQPRPDIRIHISIGFGL